MMRSLVKAAYWLLVKFCPDRVSVSLVYFRHFKKFPDLISPKNFNEKIAWRKLYQRDPLFTEFADKVAVKAHVSRLAGDQYIIETLWEGSDPTSLPFDKLSLPYVIKTNHGSGGNIFVRTKADIARSDIEASLRTHLDRSYGKLYREWGYYGVTRQILVERMIETDNGKLPEDYKFFVYRGRVRFIQLDQDRFTDHRRNLYDRDWNLLPVTLTFPPITEAVPAPASLKEMIDVAEKIGIFDFARVDLYSTKHGVKFGEITFYPGAGNEIFVPGDWDRTFGESWVLARST